MERINKKQKKPQLATRREKMNWTQEFVAHSVGVTREYINLLENRKKKNPSSIIVKKLAYLFGTTLDEIVRDL